MSHLVFVKSDNIAPVEHVFDKTNTLYLDLLKHKPESSDLTEMVHLTNHVVMQNLKADKLGHSEQHHLKTQDPKASSQAHSTQSHFEQRSQSHSVKPPSQVHSRKHSEQKSQDHSQSHSKQSHQSHSQAHSRNHSEQESRDHSQDHSEQKSQTHSRDHSEQKRQAHSRNHSEQESRDHSQLYSQTCVKSRNEPHHDNGPRTIHVKRLVELDKRKPELPKRKKQAKTKHVIHDIDEIIPDDKEKRTEIMFQYEILRKLYPDAKIAPLNKFVPMSELEAEYNTVSRKIEMATTIDKSKKVFVMVLLGTELFLGKLGLDMTGFTVDELNNMESYNDVLYELGKKYSILTESKIAPELKLLGLLTFSVLAHLISRTLEASGSETVANIVQQSTKHTFHHLFG